MSLGADKISVLIVADQGEVDEDHNEHGDNGQKDRVNQEDQSGQDASVESPQPACLFPKCFETFHRLRFPGGIIWTFP